MQTDSEADIINTDFTNPVDTENLPHVRSGSVNGHLKADTNNMVFDGSKISMLSAWRRLFEIALLWKGRLSVTIFSGLAFHISPLVLGALGSMLVVEVFNGGEIGHFTVLLIIATLIATLARWAESWASHDMAYRLLAEMRIEIFSKLEPLAPAYMLRIQQFCFNGSDGSATVTAAGGNPPLQYLWDDPAAQTNATATGLAAGSYDVTVYDANGCTETASVTLIDIPGGTASASVVTNTTGFGICDGEATSSMTVVYPDRQTTNFARFKSSFCFCRFT